MTNITDYISQVRLQQAIQVLYPKQDSILSDFYLPYTEEEAYQYLINLPFTYLSCKYLGNQYYWEFINSNSIDNFEDLQFVYIPATQSNFNRLQTKILYYSTSTLNEAQGIITQTNFNKLQSKIPYYSKWNEAKEVELIYPTKNYLIEANSVSWGSSYSINVSSGFSHPFLPTFDFTGRVCLLNQTLLYEYKDLKGYYSVKDSYYLSPLRPTDLSYPLGIPTESQLTTDECQLENSYPTSGDSYFVGEYQYQYTNSSYNPHIKFYLYANSTSQFLLQQPPKLDYKGTVLSTLSLICIEPTLILPTTPIDQSFTITQSSTTTLTMS
jgi:hypothetical protein